MPKVQRYKLRMDTAQYAIVDPDIASGRRTLSRRRKLDIPQLPDEATYVCDGTENLWQICARREVYGDPKLWWVLADANDISGHFRVMLKTIERGTELRVPALDLVRRIARNG